MQWGLCTGGECARKNVGAQHAAPLHLPFRPNIYRADAFVYRADAFVTAGGATLRRCCRGSRPRPRPRPPFPRRRGPPGPPGHPPLAHAGPPPPPPPHPPPPPPPPPRAPPGAP